MGLTDLDLSPLSHSGTTALLATVNGWSQGWWLRVVALRVPVNLLIQLLTAANNAGSQAPRISVLAKCHCDGLVSCECACVAAVSGSVNIKLVLDFDDPGVPQWWVTNQQSASTTSSFLRLFICNVATKANTKVVKLRPCPILRLRNWSAPHHYLFFSSDRDLCVQTISR